MAASGERGSVLFLMPAAVLVVVLLGAVTVDASVAYLGRRELASAAVAAANDAVTFGVDEQTYYAGGGYTLSPARVRRAVDDAVAASHVLAHDISVAVGIDGRRVTVTLEGDVDYVFGRAFPGAPHAVHVVARATAVAAGG
jgi:hypothetical protein